MCNVALRLKLQLNLFWLHLNLYQHWQVLYLGALCTSSADVLCCIAVRCVAIAFLSVVKQIPCDQGVLPEHGCLRGKNKYKLELLSFEKAWDKIQRDSADVYSSSSPFGQIPIC